MNSDRVKAKIRILSQEKNIDFNILLRSFMYDCFILRLSKSKYKDNFILKGGFYLSTLFGVENRTTMDIDAAFRHRKLSISNVEMMIKDIASIDVNDGAIILSEGIKPIMKNDLYRGYRVDISVKLDNIVEKFHIDIATGDPISPSEIRYKYLPVLGKKAIKIWAYNIETVLAEKIETILSRAEINGRLKDFYDVYLIYTRYWSSVNKEYLYNAFYHTFKKRTFAGNLSNSYQLVSQSQELRLKWKYFQRKNNYAKNINYDDIMCCLNDILENFICFLLKLGLLYEPIINEDYLSKVLDFFCVNSYDETNEN